MAKEANLGAEGMFSLFLPLSKVEKNNDGSVTVSGYASTPTLDLDGEIVSIDAIRKALPGYWQWRNIRQMHQPSAVGVAKEANIDGKGLFLTSRITDKEAAQKCLDEVYKGYSVGGRKLAKSGNTITDIELVEVSLVDRPANPDCRINVAKSAKESTGAYLVKAAKPGTKKIALLHKAADIATGITEFLKFDNPPAAHDGFSLPAPVAKNLLCKAHGVASCDKCSCAKHATVDCEKCAAKAARKLAKRDFNTNQRQTAASSGAALPDGSFPIENTQDLKNAIRAVGRAKDPAKAKAHIKSRAKTLGQSALIPDDWKSAKKLAKARQRALVAKYAPEPPELKSAEASFLSLTAEDKGKIGIADDLVLEGLGKSGHELAKGFRAEPQEGELFSLLSKRKRNQLDLTGISTLIDEGIIKMTDENTDLKKVIAEAIAKATKTTENPFKVGKANMKKAREMRKAAAKNVRDAFNMHKAAYLSKQALIKAGKKPAADDDADDFDHADAMSKLQKAHSALTSMKTFVKAASQNFAKAARPGQSGQEVTDGNEFFVVPPGVKTAPDLSTVGPGGGASGGEPPEQLLDQLFPGKNAKSSYTAAEVTMALKLAAANGKIEALEKLPAGPMHGSRRPVAFDTSGLFGKGANKDEIRDLMDGIDPRDLSSDDEDIHKKAVGTLIGNKILKGHGRSVFDPAFRGAGAGGQIQ